MAPPRRSDMRQAHSYQIYSCHDPRCGPHIVLEDDHGVAFAEIVLTDETARTMISGLQGFLYRKAVDRE